MAWNPEKLTDSFFLRLRNRKYTFWKVAGFIVACTLLSSWIGYWIGIGSAACKSVQ